MDPAKQWSFALERFVVFCRDVIDPAIYAMATPLEAEAFQCDEPVSYAEAVKATYRPVEIGWQWGPRWTTAWFRIRGTVPAGMKGKRVVLRFSTDTEALLWMSVKGNAGEGGVPHHGLDVNRDAVTLFEPAKGGESVLLHVEAACNHMFGDRGLQWDPAEIHRRWNSQTPGLFERCELAVMNEQVWRLKHLYWFALDLAKQMAPDSARGQQLLGVLRRVTNMIPDDRVAQAATRAIGELEAALIEESAAAGGGATVCHAVGHAHIDTAWLWPIRETKRKTLRTFSTVLRNMERYPEYRFLCSQAQQYAWVEERSPELFAQIKKRVADGRWEPGGAMWIEPDCFGPSGEALIRQIIHADRYWREKFGDARGAQRFLYLPDTFGFPAQLPQIMRAAGLDTFITNKLHWNSHTVFPYTTFVWRGLDGSEVLAHQTPGMDYNATNTPKELIRGEKTHKNKDLPSVSGREQGGARWLQPFGFGDGGGGPTDWSIEYARFAKSCDGLPKVRFSTASVFCDALHGDVARAKKTDPQGVPVHDGELYLELHRGTYTTHARFKQANTECEELLRQAEILTFAGAKRLSKAEESEAKAALDRAWKLVLLNQFHDILPGSSIGWVYEDAERDYAEVRAICNGLIEAGIARWAEGLGSRKMRRPVAVFNPGSKGVMGASVVISRTRDVQADGLTVLVRDESQPLSKAEKNSNAVRASKDGIESPGQGLSVRFDKVGRITSMRSREAEICREGAPMNQLVLCEDRPRLWDAWDIDPEVHEKTERIEKAAKKVDVIEAGPVSASVRFTHAIGRSSTLQMTYRVNAGSRRVEVECEVDWRERHRLLRALVPARFVGTHASVGTQFGHLSRPMGASTLRGGMFEVPAHRFVCASVEGRGAYGLSVLIDRPRGVSLGDREIGLSLLRSSTYPDPEADQGKQVLRYAIEPGSGPVFPPLSSAEEFSRPVRALELEREALKGRSEKGGAWQPLLVHAYPYHVEVESIAPGERDGEIVVRLSERSGRGGDVLIAWNIPVKRVRCTDVLGRPVVREDVEHVARDKSTTLKIKPFEIVTLAVQRAD